GRERLEPQREALYEEAQKQQKMKVLATAPEAIRGLIDTAIAQHLVPQFRLIPRGRGHQRSRGPDDEPEENRFELAALMATPEQRVVVEKVWQLIETRQHLDFEYRLHVLGRLWLLVHGPAAWALAALIVEHVWLSVWHGGF